MRYNVLNMMVFSLLTWNLLAFLYPQQKSSKKVSIIITGHETSWISETVPRGPFLEIRGNFKGPDNSSPRKLVGCFSKLPELSRNGPHKTLGFMETQGKVWGKVCQMICGPLDWKSEIDQFRYSTTEHSSYRVRKRSRSLFIFTVAGGSFLRT